MRLASRLLLVAAASGLLGALAAPPAARSLSISPNPFLVSETGVEGSIELVAVVSGVPAGGTVLLGSVDPGDTTLVLRADVTSGASAALFLGIGPVAAPGTWISLAGAGWVPGGGIDITIAGSNVPGTAGFGTGGDVVGGQSYDLVFLSYDSSPADDGSLQLAGSLLLVPESPGLATLVPEPASALLLGVGVALLAQRRRRSSTR